MADAGGLWVCKQAVIRLCTALGRLHSATRPLGRWAPALAAAGLWGALLLPACGETTGGTSVPCVEGATLPCTCMNGSKSVQTCVGGMFVACSCAAATDAVTGIGAGATSETMRAGDAVVATDAVASPARAATTDLTPMLLPELSREIDRKKRVVCPKVPLVKYRGTHARMQQPVRVHTGFVPHLQRFEGVVQEVALEVYGRQVKHIVHIGTLNCRRVGGFPHLMSEHGIGAAIDVAGFDFAPLATNQTLPKGLPAALRRSFSVRLLKHWTATDPAGAVHNRFLRLLATRLQQRPDIFRALFGPAWPGHNDHFHFDVGPFVMQKIF